VVDVAGAVGRPGLVRLRAGARVAYALAAAGGPAADAALAGVNQARVLADGERVRVPRVGEPAPAPPPPAATGAGAPGATADPVDLNRATPADLDALPGVGPATASAIVTWRDENGGFHRVDDLLEVPGRASPRPPAPDPEPGAVPPQFGAGFRALRRSTVNVPGSATRPGSSSPAASTWPAAADSSTHRS